MDDRNVLIVSRPGDEHGDLVEEALRSGGIEVARLSLDVFRRRAIEWRPTCPLIIGDEAGSFSLRDTSTVWWRRPGWVEIEDLAPDEAELIDAEVRCFLVGTLFSAAGRWVDPPHVVELAENKMHQLATAKAASIPIPDSLVTTRPDVARRFASGRKVIAKTVSAGEGLAPYVEEAPEEFLDRVRYAPVLLQERVGASADLRVVTVGRNAFLWRRRRSSADVIDWRREDPNGEAFISSDDENLAEFALHLAECLGLTYSSQDWLETGTGPVFLEANPTGQWLFLEEAEERVVPTLVDHLCGRAG